MESRLSRRIRGEIEARGPLPFSRFMELALYDAEDGYYLRPRDPFGKQGDFFTAAQMQPVFGRLIAAQVAVWRTALGEPAEFQVIELGAGRGEMEPYLAPFGYHGVDAARGRLPERLTGVVFANEFFDALPVDAARRRAGVWHEMNVACAGEAFAWREGAALKGAALEFARANAPAEDDVEEAEWWLELPWHALEWMERLAGTLDRGFLLALDYGYTRREARRFPRGTLMSYRRHQAVDDVLQAPGEQDITAHVPFTALRERAAACGLGEGKLENQAALLLRCGERDQFAGALRAESEREAAALRGQLKTLLFGMGENFRALTFARGQ